MKHRKIMEPEPDIPERFNNGYGACAYLTDTYLILDIYEDNRWRCRHATDPETGEYETYDVSCGAWERTQLINATGLTHSWYYTFPASVYQLSEQDEQMILRAIPKRHYGWHDDNAYGRISDLEQDYAMNKREAKEMRRKERINDVMSMFRTPGEKVNQWLTGILENKHYAFYDKTRNECSCTACGKRFKPEEGTKHKSQTVCPRCAALVQVEKGRTAIKQKIPFLIIEPLRDGRSTERMFNLDVTWAAGNDNVKARRICEANEDIRLVFDREGNMKIYYDTWRGWETTNPDGRRWKAGYLYPGKIREALECTAYDPWKDVFPMMAAAGQKADYNRLMIGTTKDLANTAEYLLKGRFYRLLTDVSQGINIWTGGITQSVVSTHGQTIEEVMGVEDRQLINRLRQEDGGVSMLQWLQYSDQLKVKLSQDTLKWLEKEKFDAMTFYKAEAARNFTPEQFKNYIERQKKESCKGMNARSIANEYEDYIRMAKDLGKDVDDEMVYRPRELKRRHDECVEECNRRRAELERKKNKALAKQKAAEMRKKYPGYQKILREVKEKYEYKGDTYMIRVPKNFTEITDEGMALHHCVGNTERYFDRIVSRETYIVFLRKIKEPNTPFYTIEVEPGGTIRQHRGMYDEEPDIDQIKPFLRQWQRVIRRRMSKADHSFAEKSALLRKKNIEELIANNNKRVLDGLAEDFMDVTDLLQEVI